VFSGTPKQKPGNRKRWALSVDPVSDSHSTVWFRNHLLIILPETEPFSTYKLMLRSAMLIAYHSRHENKVSGFIHRLFNQHGWLCDGNRVVGDAGQR
jgi:hypothetical protein